MHDLVVQGIPVSLQAKSAENKLRWKQTVTAAAHEAVPVDEKYLEDQRLAVVIIHFCFDWSQGDLDNIAKLILDGLSGPAYSDDQQIVQLLIRRTELGSTTPDTFFDPPPRLAAALQKAYRDREDFVYIRIGAEPDHGRLP